MFKTPQLAVLFENAIDDSLTDEFGEIFQPAGKKVALLLQKSLSNSGIRVGQLISRSFYGWEFEIIFRERTFLAVVQRVECYVLVLGCQPNPCTFWLKSHVQILNELATLIASVLEADNIGTFLKIERM